MTRLLCVLSSLLISNLVFAQPEILFSESALTPSSEPVDSFFGSGVVSFGDLTLVSDIRAEEVHVFTRAGGTWSDDDVVSPETPIADEGFGFSLALAGDTFLVGAPFPGGTPSVENGSVYVFTRGPGGVTQSAQLTPPAGSMYLRFGWAVALDGEDVAFVGAPHAGGFAGMVFRFERSGNTWSLAQTLNPGGGPPGASFGASLALDGDTLLVGAPTYDDPGVMRVGSGGTYVFQRFGGWTQTQLLRPADIADRDFFGGSLALRGNTALIGSRLADGPAELDQNAGAVYVFERLGGDFVENEKLTAPSPAENGFFGWSLALGADIAFIGAIGDVDERREAAHVFPLARTSSGSFTLGTPLEAENTPRHLSFGRSLALSDDVLFVGEPGGNAAWVYEVMRSCVDAVDCGDGDVCTNDTCDGNTCAYTAIAGCGEPDAGPMDAGPLDAGLGDAGPRDAGPNPSADAGADAASDAMVADGGLPNVEDDGGCGCRTASSKAPAPFAFALMFAVGMILRRRR